MAVRLSETNGGKVIEVRVTGELTAEDYALFVPEFERLIKEHGTIRVLFEMVDFHGWKAAAMWEDFKVAMKHFPDIERLAMVGDTHWEKALSDFCRAFMRAKIRYFDLSKIDEARVWLEREGN